MRSVLVFDLNGTLTDLAVLDPHFQSAFGTAAIRREWFNEMIQLSMAATLTGHYVEFAKLDVDDRRPCLGHDGRDPGRLRSRFPQASLRGTRFTGAASTFHRG